MLDVHRDAQLGPSAPAMSHRNGHSAQAWGRLESTVADLQRQQKDDHARIARLEQMVGSLARACGMDGKLGVGTVGSSPGVDAADSAVDVRSVDGPDGWVSTIEATIVKQLRNSKMSLGMVLGGGDGVKPVYVHDLIPDGAAEQQSAIRQGDLIVAINGRNVSEANMAEAQQRLQETGDTVHLVLQRDPRFVNKLVESTSHCNRTDNSTAHGGTIMSPIMTPRHGDHAALRDGGDRADHLKFADHMCEASTPNDRMASAMVGGGASMSPIMTPRPGDRAALRGCVDTPPLASATPDPHGRSTEPARHPPQRGSGGAAAAAAQTTAPAAGREPRVAAPSLVFEPQDTAAQAVCSKFREDHPHAICCLATVLKDPAETLGMSIQGGSRAAGTPPGIFVVKMVQGGPVCRGGTISVGDRILTVDGVDLTTATKRAAVNVLKACNSTVRILVARPSR